MTEPTDIAVTAALSALDRVYSAPSGFPVWLEEQVITVDETKRKPRPWPQNKAYLRDLTHALLTENKLAIPKSRRMMVTWCLVAYACWRARYHGGEFIVWQSETFTKAVYALGNTRLAYIEDNLRDAPLRRKYEALSERGGNRQIKYLGKQHGKSSGANSVPSTIIATAQGATVLNTYTPSLIILDESDLQPWSHQTFANALPLLETGVQMILCTTSNGPSGLIAEMARSVGFGRFT